MKMKLNRKGFTLVYLYHGSSILHVCGHACNGWDFRDNDMDDCYGWCFNSVVLSSRLTCLS